MVDNALTEFKALPMAVPDRYNLDVFEGLFYMNYKKLHAKSIVDIQ